MKQVFVVAFPDCTYLDEDGQHTTFFYAKTFDTHDLAFEFAVGVLGFGIHFRIDKLHVQTIA